MFKETKNRFKSVCQKVLRTGILFASLAGLLLVPSLASAANLNANGGITITTALEVDGKPENLVRMVKNQPAQVTVIVTISELKTKEGGTVQQLKLGPSGSGADTLDFNLTFFGQRPALSLGVGADVIGANTTCKTRGVAWNPITSTDYTACTFATGGKQMLAGTTFQVGQPYRVTFNLDSSTLASFGASAAPGVAGQFNVAPFIVMDIAGGTDPNYTLSAAGKTVYVVQYNTKAELDAAAATGERPKLADGTTVPGYGSNTGSTQTNDGDALATFLQTIVTIIAGIVNEFVYLVFSYLLVPLVQAMLSIHPYTDQFVNVIYPGWEVIRNFTNILFVAALIAIALGTLFQSSKYQYKTLLVKLITAALLVNFSLVIAQAVLGIADTVQNQFLPNRVDVIRELGKDLMVANTRQAFFELDIKSLKGTYSGTVANLFYVALSIGSFCLFGALALFLVIRMVMLWIYLLLSPIAYVAGVIPATADLQKKWWDGFLKYAFFTPIIAFFLQLTAIMSNVQRSRLLQNITAQDFEQSTLPGLSAFIFKVGGNVVLLVFLIVAIKVADSMGIAGAKGLTAMAEKGVWAPFKFAGGVTTFGGKKLRQGAENVLGVPLRPEMWKKAWEAESARRDHEHLDKLGGRGLASKIPGIKNLGLANPEHFFKHYISWDGATRMAKATFAGSFGFWQKRVSAAEKKASLMTDDKRDELATQLAEVKSNLVSLGKGQITKEKAQQIRTSLDEQVRIIEEKDKGILDKAKKELADATKAGASATVIGEKTAQVKDIEDQVELLKKKAAEVGTAIADDSKTNVNLSDLKLKDLESDLYHKKASTELLGKVGEFSDLDSEKKALEKKYKDLEGKESDDSIARADAGIDRYKDAAARAADSTYKGVTKDYIAAAKKDLTNLKMKAASRKAPDNFVHRQGRLNLENQYKKQLADIQSSDELIQLLDSAIARKNQFEAVAIMKQLSQNVDLNDYLDDHRGFGMGYDGMQKLYQNVMKQELGMDDHSALQAMSEISYINEGKNVMSGARLVGVKDGHLHMMSKQDHEDAIVVQSLKLEPQGRARDLRRFTLVDEDAHAGTKTLTDAGAKILVSFDYDKGLVQLDRAQSYSIAAITKDPQWKSKLKKEGATNALIEKIETIAKNAKTK